MRSRQILVAAVAAVLLSALFFFFVLKPKLDDISSARAEVETAQDEERALRNELVRLEGLREQTVRTRARLAKATKFLPDTPDLPGFIRLAQEAATDSGVTLKSIAPSPPADVEGASGVQEIQVTLTLSGGFRRIEDLLSRLERLDRVVEVRQLSMAPGSDGLGDQVVLDTTITVVMYAAQETARAGGSGTTVARDRPAPAPEAS